MARPSPEDIAELFRVHRGEEATSERSQRAYSFDDTATWQDSRGYRLSDRIWGARQSTLRQITELLRLSLSNGEDALLTARKLEEFLDPAFAPRRDALGKLRTGQKASIVTRSPGRGGMGSYPARRLARTETSRAHAQATDFAAARTPLALGWKWNLSARHPEEDECTEYANRVTDLGLGVYPPNEGPELPAHPMCLCFKTIVVPEDTDAIVDELKRRYGI